MRADRPLIAAVLCLAGGLALIIIYCTGASSMSAAYPIAISSLHVELTVTGPAELGGLALTALGLVLLVWAFLAAIVDQVSLLGGHRDREHHYDHFGSITKGDERFTD